MVMIWMLDYEINCSSELSGHSLLNNTDNMDISHRAYYTQYSGHCNSAYSAADLYNHGCSGRQGLFSSQCGVV